MQTFHPNHLGGSVGTADHPPAETLNPYAPPSWVPGADERLGGRGTALRLVRSLARWTLICVVSALPSFFWGCGLHQEFRHVAAMLCGIGLFVIGYTAIECSSVFRQIVALPYVRRTLLIGYGTRLFVSIVFPLGLALDMFVGMLSVGLIASAAATASPDPSLFDAVDGRGASFLLVLVTTILQGLFLNLLLGGYMLLVYATQRLIAAARESAAQHV
jgi:hypothetical protein